MRLVQQTFSQFPGMAPGMELIPPCVGDRRLNYNLAWRIGELSIGMYEASIRFLAVVQIHMISSLGSSRTIPKTGRYPNLKAITWMPVITGMKLRHDWQVDSVMFDLW